jgi:hypothetical protein
MAPIANIAITNITYHAIESSPSIHAKIDAKNKPTNAIVSTPFLFSISFYIVHCPINRTV